MIGYDIDGVFLPDLDLDKCPAQSDLIYLVTAHCIGTLFVPEGEYVLITGRPESIKADTQLWADRVFKQNPPLKIYHDNTDPNLAAQYKSKVLSENPDITVFIESSKPQVEYLKQHHPDRQILHFSTDVVLQNVSVL